MMRSQNEYKSMSDSLSHGTYPDVRDKCKVHIRLRKLRHGINQSSNTATQPRCAYVYVNRQIKTKQHIPVQLDAQRNELHLNHMKAKLLADHL